MVAFQTRWTTAVVIAVLTIGCSASPDDSLEANKALVRAFAEASNAHDYERIREILTPNFQRHSQATPGVVVTSPEEMIAFLRANAESFPDERVTIKRVIAEDSLVAVWATYSGTQEGPMGPFPPSHKTMAVDFGAVFRIEGNRIAELWVTWDNLTGLTQLGHFPPEPPDSL